MFTIAGLIEMVIRTITKAPKLTIQHRQVTVVDWYLCIQIWDLSGLGFKAGAVQDTSPCLPERPM